MKCAGSASRAVTGMWKDHERSQWEISAKHGKNLFMAWMKTSTTQTAGEVYAMHFIYSGNFIAQLEKSQFDSIRAVMGIHPADFSWKLESEEVFYTPEVALTFSAEGLGKMTRNFPCYGADGGLYAELVQNRDFEYTPTDRGNDQNWNSTHSWSVQGSDATLSTATENPIHPNNPHYAVFDVNAAEQTALVNAGFDGIALKKGEKYDFSLFGKVLEGKGGKVLVNLVDKDGTIIGQTAVNVTSKDWKQQKAVLTATSDAAAASLSIVPQAVSKYALDMISLFPQKTFKGRKNGLRADLAQTLADLHPRFVRFPGGCVAHGVANPAAQRLGHHRRRRLAGHRRQPLHPRHPPQRGPQRHSVQQRDLRPDQRPVLPHFEAGQDHQNLALRHGREAVQPRRTGDRRQGHVLRPVGGHGGGTFEGVHGGRRDAQRHVGSRSTAKLRDIQRQDPR